VQPVFYLGFTAVQKLLLQIDIVPQNHRFSL